MNDMLFGGFLIFYTPRLQVFVDDRCDLYGDKFLLDYDRASPTFFEGWLKKSGAQVALTEPGSSLDRYFKRASGWHLEKQTPAASFYRKSDG